MAAKSGDTSSGSASTNAIGPAERAHRAVRVRCPQSPAGRIASASRREHDAGRECATGDGVRSSTDVSLLTKGGRGASLPLRTRAGGDAHNRIDPAVGNY